LADSKGVLDEKINMIRMPFPTHMLHCSSWKRNLFFKKLQTL